MNTISLLLYIVLAIIIQERSEFGLFFLIYTAVFALYYWQSSSLKSQSSKWWLWAIAFRLPFVISIPYLSDDFYRFIWDGILQNQSVNPYLYLPSEIATTVSQLEIYKNLNSPNYYSVYPPLNQFLFSVATLISPKNILGQVIGMRVLLWFFELGAIWLMYWTIQKKELVLVFALNPLLIVESTGNLHFEIVIVFFVILALYLFQKYPKSWYSSAVSLGAAISVKLIPVLLLPLVFFQLTTKRGVIFSLITFLIALLSFLPYWNHELINNFLESINLFFRNFEFNASMYYIVREIGFWITGYNIIHLAGMGLKITAGLLILFISFKTKDIAKGVVAILFIYLAFATTMHPWYLIPLLAATCYTNIRFPIIWTFLVMLSYHAYSAPFFAENLWIVSTEYFFLGVYIWLEYKKGLLKLW